MLSNIIWLLNQGIICCVVMWCGCVVSCDFCLICDACSWRCSFMSSM